MNAFRKPVCARAILACTILQGTMIAQISATGERLQVVTANAVAIFQGPDLVGFTNSTTGEAYLRLPRASPELDFSTDTPSNQALRSSGWSIRQDDASGLETATLTMRTGNRQAVIAVYVDPATEEIAVRLSGQTSGPGLRGLAWTMAGLDMQNGQLIVPADTGLVFDRDHRGVGTSIRYPHRWHAQMLVYQSQRGSMVLYSRDTELLFKQLALSARDGATVDLNLQTQARTPWSESTSVPALEWRIKAVAGDWRNAAKIYADWLAVARPPETGPQREWTRRIRTVANIAVLDTSLLDRLAGQVDPSKTLVYIPAWRTSDFDVNYPDYTPRTGLANFIGRAHRLGFRVILHANFYGVSPGNPDYAGVRPFQIRDPFTQRLAGWMWDSPESTRTRFAHISPASPAFRQLLVSRLRTAVEAAQPDAIHLDQAALVQWNDENGAIDGVSQLEGAVQLHRDLLNAFPGVALGSEAANDIFYPYLSFAQSWWEDPESPLLRAQPGHPIAQYLFGGQMLYYGHLGQPGARDPGFLDFVRASEPRGFQPGIYINSALDIDPSNREVSRLLRLVRSWQQHEFQPAWTSDWSGSVIRYAGSDGATAELTDNGSQIRMVAAGSTLYERLYNVNQKSTAGYIPNWPAFDSERIYGMDPARQYWLDEIPRPETTQISSLPDGVKAGPDLMITPRFAIVDLRPVLANSPANVSVPIRFGAGAEASGFTGSGALTLPSNAQALVTGVPVPGRFVLFTAPGSPVSRGRSLLQVPFEVRSGSTGDLANSGPPFSSGRVSAATAGGVVHQSAVFAHPPTGGRTVLSWTVRLPEDAPLRLDWAFGIGDGAASETGVEFSVKINGVRYWRASTGANSWSDAALDLSNWRGQTVLIQLVTDSLGSSGFDWAYWADLRFSAAGASCQFSAPSARTAPATGGSFIFTVATSPACPWAATADVPWISLGAEGGTGTSVVTYSVAFNGGAARSGIITVAGQTLTVTQARGATAEIQAVYNAWSYTPGTAPGAWVTISGPELTRAGPRSWNLSGANSALPDTLGDTRVLIGGTPAAIAYVSPGQINALVPSVVSPGPLAIVVEYNGFAGPPFNTIATPTQPAIYAPPGPDGALFVTAALAGTASLVGNRQADPRVARAALPGDTLDLYMIGLGATADPARFVTNRVFSGASPIAAPISVTVDRRPAAVSFAGLVSPGLYQVRVTVPVDLSPGPRPIEVVAGEARSGGATFLMIDPPVR